MAQKNKQLNVSDVDFDRIKLNLKEFLRSQDTFRDYNFEGSALGTLIDVLSYVTHYNAVNANLGINETFLETAQTRESVVGHARQLGYTPRSMIGATAIIDIGFNDPNTNNLFLPKNHRFRSTFDGVSYGFVTTKAYETTNGFFGDVEIKQGILRRIDFIYDVDTSERFIIPETNVDTSTIVVRLRDSQSSTTLYTYNEAKSIINITGESQVFFLNETFGGRYEITFGDNVIGKRPTNGNIIEVDYLITEGPDANGASTFSMIDDVEGNTSVNIATISRAQGGEEKESIKQIKSRAPLSFAAQNRAVTTDDYRAIIFENFPNVDSISVWGGEDNDPPAYGKVFISIKPSNAETLSDGQKDFIINQVLKPKSIASITPEFIDPEYTRVSLEVFYKYNSSKTTLTEAQISDNVRKSILQYNDTFLKRSDGVLRYSSLLNAIDNSDDAIINSIAKVYMKKRFVPILGANNIEYELNFSSPIYTAASKDRVIYRSSAFTLEGEQCTFQDYVNARGERRLRIIKDVSTAGTNIVNQIVVARDVGFIDEARGRIVIQRGFSPSAFVGSFIEITVISNSNDVAPKRNNLVLIDPNDVFIIGDDDKITTGSAAGGLGYRLIPRHSQ